MKIKPQIAARRIARARSAIGLGITYRLGHGGFRPTVSTPTTTSACDCSGFVAWVLELKRDRRNTWWTKFLPWKQSAWIETTNIYKDALSTNSVFVRLLTPEPGCIVVFPDSGGRQGHVGIVSAVRSFSDFDVVDCASRTPAISERSGSVFVQHSAIFCCLKQDLA